MLLKYHQPHHIEDLLITALAMSKKKKSLSKKKKKAMSKI